MHSKLTFWLAHHMKLKFLTGSLTLVFFAPKLSRFIFWGRRLGTIKVFSPQDMLLFQTEEESQYLPILFYIWTLQSGPTWQQDQEHVRTHQQPLIEKEHWCHKLEFNLQAWLSALVITGGYNTIASNGKSLSPSNTC